MANLLEATEAKNQLEQDRLLQLKPEFQAKYALSVLILNLLETDRVNVRPSLIERNPFSRDGSGPTPDGIAFRTTTSFAEKFNTPRIRGEYKAGRLNISIEANEVDKSAYKQEVLPGISRVEFGPAGIKTVRLNNQKDDCAEEQLLELAGILSDVGIRVKRLRQFNNILIKLGF